MYNGHTYVHHRNTTIQLFLHTSSILLGKPAGPNPSHREHQRCKTKGSFFLSFLYLSSDNADAFFAVFQLHQEDFLELLRGSISQESSLFLFWTHQESRLTLLAPFLACTTRKGQRGVFSCMSGCFRSSLTSVAMSTAKSSPDPLRDPSRVSLLSLKCASCSCHNAQMEPAIERG